MAVYRGYEISYAPQSPSLLKVSVEGQGGKIPDVLTGLFSDHTTVKQVIDTYLDYTKARRNGKTDPESGS